MSDAVPSTEPNRPPAPTLQVRLTGPMVLLSLVYLTLVAAMLPQLPRDGDFVRLAHAEKYLIPLLAVWSAFVAEAILYFATLGHRWNWKRRLHAIAVALVPALRIGFRPDGAPQQVWIPGIGWRTADRALRKRLSQALTLPMVVIALMILPLLALEYIPGQADRQNVWLAAIVEIGTRIIWLAFAVEFLVMISAHDKKIAYCKKNWIDLAIIILPFISFLRALRVMRLSRMTRLYRVRGLGFKLLRAMVIFRVSDRMGHGFARRRLIGLREKLTVKEEEMEELREEIAELETELARAAGAEEAGEAKKGEVDSSISPR